MMKNVLIILFLFFANSSFSQMVLHDPVSARTFNTQQYSDIKGSPFLFDKWIKGHVVTEKGIYQNLELKIDVYANKLFFNKEGEAFEFQDQIKGFTLMPNALDSTSFLHFKKNISTDDLKSNQYFQTLAEGKLNLYKQNRKLLTELNEINAGVIKSFSNVTKYYLLKGNDFQEIRISRKNVLEDLVQDHHKKIELFIKEQKLSTYKEKDLVKIISYYNSLQ